MPNCLSSWMKMPSRDLGQTSQAAWTGIGDLCTATFTEQDIEASKRRLFELCADDSCTRMRKRIGPKRSSQNIEDIIRLLQEKGTDTPTFVALDLAKLPPVTFDSINVSALLQSIRQNEAEINIVQMAHWGGQ